MVRGNIFICYHNEEKKIQNKVIKPLNVGAALNEIDSCILKDNIGDNISKKNDKYCEITALYWMWKNSSHLDYLGLFHYRRLLFLNKYTTLQANEETIYLDSFNINLAELGLNELNIQKLMQEFDIILPERWDVRNSGALNIYEQYKMSEFHYIQHLDLAQEIIKEKHPDFVPSMKKSMSSPYGFFTNIFIMRTEIITKYCEWLFPILFEIENQIDDTNFSVQEKRYIGYLSERLFNIYFNKLLEENSYKVLYSKKVFIKSNPDRIKLNKMLEKNKEIIVFGTGSLATNFVSKTNHKIISYIDNDRLKHGQKFMGIEICSPDILILNEFRKYKICVCSSFYNEISEQLKNMGLIEGEDFYKFL